jgi:hypothetical protein
LPQWFAHAIPDDPCGRFVSVFAGRPRNAPVGGLSANGALLQPDTRDAAPTEMRIDALDDEGSKMLQFQSEARLHPHDERGWGTQRAWCLSQPQGWPLEFDRPRHGGEPFANDLIPKQNKSAYAKPSPRHNRIDDALDKIGERPGPR